MSKQNVGPSMAAAMRSQDELGLTSQALELERAAEGAREERLEAGTDYGRGVEAGDYDEQPDSRGGR